MHIIRPETLWHDKSRRESRIGLYAWLPAEKNESRRVSRRVMYIIRSETLGETVWREKSRQQYRQKSHRESWRESRQDLWPGSRRYCWRDFSRQRVSPRVSNRIICMTLGETLSETRFCTLELPFSRFTSFRHIYTLILCLFPCPHFGFPPFTFSLLPRIHLSFFTLSGSLLRRSSPFSLFAQDSPSALPHLPLFPLPLQVLHFAIVIFFPSAVSYFYPPFPSSQFLLSAVIRSSFLLFPLFYPVSPNVFPLIHFVVFLTPPPPPLSLSLSLIIIIIIITNISIPLILLLFYRLSFKLFHIFVFVILFICIIFLHIVFYMDFVFYLSVCCILFGHMVLPWPNKLNQSINQSISPPF